MTSAASPDRKRQFSFPRSSELSAAGCLNKARKRRSGVVLVFITVLMVLLFALLAFAVDLGYLCTVRTELQRTADAGALAGAAAIYHPVATLTSATYSLPPDPGQARHEARQFVQENPGAARSLDVDLNWPNDSSGDIVVGRLFYPADHTEPLDTTFDPPNTVRVRVALTADSVNGVVPLFFTRVLGIADVEAGATATATVWYPALLPFTTSTANWESLATGGGGDQFAYQPGRGSLGVGAGPDGVPEIRMFPGPWNGEGDLPPGNFGVIKIGPSGLVINTLRRQIDMGPSQADMEVHGGQLTGGDEVAGRTGLKSSSKHAFLGGYTDSRNFGGILGRVRQLPLYERAVGNGNNCVFTLSRFVMVRVMAIKMNGRWRTDYRDTEGDDIEGIAVQPITDATDLIQVQLSR